MRFICFWLLLACLYGCGSNSGTAEKKLKNTAPYITGELSHIVKAKVQKQIVFNVTDNNHDVITASMSPSFEWAELVHNEDSLLLKVSPDLYDIGQYEISITLSDGALSNSYQVVLDIADNPETWQISEIGEADLYSPWVSEDNRFSISFTPEQGVLIDNTDLHSFTYDSKESTRLKAKPYACTNNCETSMYDLTIVARDGERLRANYVGSTGELRGINLTKFTAQTDQISYYASSEQNQLNLAQVDWSDNEPTLMPVIINSPLSFGSELSMYPHHKMVSFHPSAQEQFDFEVSALEHPYVVFVAQKKGGGNEYVSATLEFDSIKVITQHSGYLAVYAEYHFAMLHHAYPLSEYIDLEQVLETQTSLTVFEQITPISTPEFKLGVDYFGEMLVGAQKLKVKELELEHKGVELFQLNEDGVGAVNLAKSTIYGPATAQFNYQLSENEVTTQHGGEFNRHQFFELADGRLATSSEHFVGGERKLVGKTMRYFGEVTTTQWGDLPKGEYSYKSEYSFYGVNLNINEKGTVTATMSKMNAITPIYQKIELDGSVSLIEKKHCPSAYDFDSCKDEYHEEYDLSFVTNLQLLQQRGNNLTVKDSFAYESGTQNEYISPSLEVIESLISLTKKE